MKQYFSIKERHKDAILMFRLGDFTNVREDGKGCIEDPPDRLTSREKAKEDPIPMCGIPFFAADSYIAKLVKAGHKVAVCEQMEEAKEGKGIVQRDVVKVITARTYTQRIQRE